MRLLGDGPQAAECQETILQKTSSISVVPNAGAPEKEIRGQGAGRSGNGLYTYHEEGKTQWGEGEWRLLNRPDVVTTGHEPHLQEAAAAKD